MKYERSIMSFTATNVHQHFQGNIIESPNNFLLPRIRPLRVGNLIIYRDLPSVTFLYSLKYTNPHKVHSERPLIDFGGPTQAH